MAIAIDNVSGVVGTAVSSLTIAHTVAAGAVLVAFAAALGDTPTVTGVTYNSVALTQLLGTTDDSGGVLATNSAWIIHNPASGTHDLVATFSAAGSSNSALHGLSYTGVEATSAAAAHRAPYHNGAGDVTVVDSVSGDMVVGSCGNYDFGAGAISAGATWNSRRFDNAISGGSYALGSEDTIATGASTVVVFTNDNDFSTNIAFALIPAAAGGGALTNAETDAITLGEATTLELNAFIVITESVTTGEIVGGTVGVAFLVQLNVTEAITLGETLTIRIPFLRSAVNESIVLGEAAPIYLPVEAVNFAQAFAA